MAIKESSFCLTQRSSQLTRQQQKSNNFLRYRQVTSQKKKYVTNFVTSAKLSSSYLSYTGELHNFPFKSWRKIEMSHSYQLLEMNTTNGGMHRGSKDVKRKYTSSQVYKNYKEKNFYNSCHERRLSEPPVETIYYTRACIPTKHIHEHYISHRTTKITWKE